MEDSGTDRDDDDDEVGDNVPKILFLCIKIKI
jgi:hypothetical protein